MSKELFEFEDVGNYRGNVEVRRVGDAYFWRVACDVYGSEWQPIPEHLYLSLKKHYDDTHQRTDRGRLHQV